jgi:hypothetical protein
MLAGLPALAGVQFLLGALHYDVESIPRQPLQADAADRVAAQKF